MADTRVVYGMCTWWDTIDKVGLMAGPGSLPCCPHCKSPLFEMESLEAWWASVDKHAEHEPDYRQFIEWLRGKCYGSHQEAKGAYFRVTTSPNYRAGYEAGVRDAFKVAAKIVDAQLTQ